MRRTVLRIPSCFCTLSIRQIEALTVKGALYYEMGLRSADLVILGQVCLFVHWHVQPDPAV